MELHCEADISSVIWGEAEGLPLRAFMKIRWSNILGAYYDALLLTTV